MMKEGTERSAAAPSDRKMGVGQRTFNTG
jgi:hypothetical protein